MQFKQMFVTAVCVLFLLKLKWPKSKIFINYVYDRASPRGWGYSPTIPIRVFAAQRGCVFRTRSRTWNPFSTLFLERGIVFLFLLFQTITTVTMKPTLQKGQSTKHISTHRNLHITTYNKNLQYATYREKKDLN